MNEDWLWTIFWSVLPISELRGGIPYAFTQGLNPILAYFVCVGVNLLAFPIVYFFLEFFHPLFNKWSFYNTLFEKIIVRTRKKVEGPIAKYGFWGLMVFVMIPLPVTGAYTGSLASWVFEIDKKKSIMAVAFGVAIAGIIVTAIMVSGSTALNFLIKDVSHIG